MVILDASIIVTALPTIQNSFHAQLSDLQWVVDAFTLAFAALILTGGTLGDRFGRKRFFLIGLVLFLVGSTLCGFAPAFDLLIVGRVVQGIGAAALAPGSLSVLAAAFQEPRERARAIGIWAGVSGLGLAIGPFAGGLLVKIGDWPAIFFVNLPIGILVLALSVPKLSESRNPNALHIDLPGQILVTGGLICLVMALIEGSSAGWTSLLIVGLLIGAAVCILAFLLVEARGREPMISLSLFMNPGVLDCQYSQPCPWLCNDGNPLLLRTVLTECAGIYRVWGWLAYVAHQCRDLRSWAICRAAHSPYRPASADCPGSSTQCSVFIPDRHNSTA